MHSLRSLQGDGLLLSEQWLYKHKRKRLWRMCLWHLLNLNKALIKILKHNKDFQQAWAKDLKLPSGL